MQRHTRTFVLLSIAAIFALFLTFSIMPFHMGGNGDMALAGPGAGWEVQEVDLVRPVVNGMAAVDANTAWAVGGDIGKSYLDARGFILKTTDGGKHWGFQGPQDIGILNDVCAVDANTAWAVGGGFSYAGPFNGLILKTTDGGNTWQVQSNAGGYVLMGISALDANVALAAGGRMTYENMQYKYYGVVLLTTDGGAHWSPLYETGNDFFQDVALVDLNTAWAVGQTVIKTSNAGATWVMQKSTTNPTAPFKKISAVNAATAWLVGPSSVFKTSNGGSSWQEHILQTGVACNDVAAVDTSTAWVATGTMYMTNGPNGAVFKTKNGGGSWEQLDPGLPFYTVICAPTATAAWASGMFAMVKTDDGGVSWDVQSPDFDCDFLSISALDADFSIATGKGGMFAYYAPEIAGVLAWPGPAVNAPATNDIWAVEVLDSGGIWTDDTWDAWVAGSGGFIVRLGNPTTFQDPGIDNDLYDMSAVDGTTAWVVGQDVILKTGDGGTTWAVQVNAPLKINGVSAVDPLTAWAVAEGGLAGRTTDGITWNAMSTGTSNELNGVAAIDALSAWAVGTGGTIVKTTNGGISWTAQASGNSADLFGISAVDIMTAWAVGAGGTILKTSDGGATWIRQDSKTANTLHDVCAVDNNVAWAAGEHKTILKTTDGGGSAESFSVTSVAPNTGSQFAWALNLQVTGTGFLPGAAVRLEKGAAVLNAYGVSVVSGNQITCTVGTFGAEPGVYDVVVVNPDGGEARLPGAFTVTSPCGAGSGTALLMLGLTLGLLSLAGTARVRRRRRRK